MREILVPWDSQPQEAVEVDWDNPITRGLAHLFVGPGQRSVLRGDVLTLSGVVEQRFVDGIAASYFSNSHLSETSIVQAVPLTLAAVGYVENVSSSARTLVSIANPFADSNYFQLGTNTNGTIRVVARSSPQGYHASNTTNAVQLNRHFVALGVYASESSRVAWLNGLKAAANTVTVSPTNQTRTRYGSLARSVAGDGMLGGIALAAIWGRALTDDEAVSFSANPWQLFAPRTQYIPTASGVLVPTLSLSTFVPGTLTASGWRPQVTTV